MRPSTAKTSAIVLGLVPLAILSVCVSAQSSGNDDVCLAPVGAEGSIGNVSFDTAISSSPLFWIATVKHDNDRRMTRQFHLFTEDRRLQLGTDDGNFNGCALALTGVMKTDRQAMLPGVDGQSDPGCTSILGEECAADVLGRARDELNAVLRNATDATAQQVCGDVRDALFTSSPPASCAVNIWASISDMVLTGAETPDVTNSTYVEGEWDCTDGPQVTELYDQGNTFSLFPLPSFGVPQDGSLEEAGEWIRAAAPLISLFWAKDGTTATALDESLNCVAATNGTDAALPQEQASAAASLPAHVMATSWALVLTAIGVTLC